MGCADLGRAHPVGQRPESAVRGDDRGSPGQRQLQIAAVMGRVAQLHGPDQLAQN